MVAKSVFTLGANNPCYTNVYNDIAEITLALIEQINRKLLSEKMNCRWVRTNDLAWGFSSDTFEGFTNVTDDNFALIDILKDQKSLVHDVGSF